VGGSVGCIFVCSGNAPASLGPLVDKERHPMQLFRPAVGHPDGLGVDRRFELPLALLLLEVGLEVGEAEDPLALVPHENLKGLERVDNVNGRDAGEPADVIDADSGLAEL
jgi:hypothetical protein